MSVNHTIVRLDLRILELHCHSKTRLQGVPLVPAIGTTPTVPVFDLYVSHTPLKRNAMPRTYRQAAMARGFYIGHHFGKPVHLRMHSQRIILRGENAEAVIWPYLVKYLLTMESIAQGYLHLKTAAIGWNGRAFLILGRGGAGKTVLLRHLCAMGATALCNTHALVKHGFVYGVQTLIRVRTNDSEEFVTPYEWTQGRNSRDPFRIAGIIWYQHRTDTTVRIDQLAPEALLENARLFSEAVANWELKEDFADAYEGPSALARVIEDVDRQLGELVHRVPCYHVTLDATRRESLIQLLSEFDRVVAANAPLTSSDT
jgi:hypothetical protein